MAMQDVQHSQKPVCEARCLAACCLGGATCTNKYIPTYQAQSPVPPIVTASVREVEWSEMPCRAQK